MGIRVEKKNTAILHHDPIEFEARNCYLSSFSLTARPIFSEVYGP